jgi:hypothetical protein
MNSLIDTAGEWFEKLPSLPKDAKELLVKITPWVALIFGVLGVLRGIAGLGILTVFSPLAMMGGVKVVGLGFISPLLWLISSALLLAAFPGANKRKTQGWNFLVYSEAVSLITNILAVSLSGVIFTLVAFYLIYQIRSYYR